VFIQTNFFSMLCKGARGYKLQECCFIFVIGVHNFSITISSKNSLDLIFH
jgi:hypothetical protein